MTAGLRVALVGGAGVVAAWVFAWPASGVLRAVFQPEVWSGAGLSARRVELLLRGAGVAAAAAALAQLLGAALASALNDRRRGGRRLAAWVGASVLLTPPYIYAYAWSLPLLPAGIASSAPLASPVIAWLATTGRAVWCLGCWLTPLAAVVLACGWRTHGRPAAALAALDATGARVFGRAVLPAMWPWIAGSLLLTATLALTEFSVCHLCRVMTWNTEILAELQIIARPGSGIVLAWPLLAMVAALALPLMLLRGRAAEALRELARFDDDADGRESRSDQAATKPRSHEATELRKERHSKSATRHSLLSRRSLWPRALPAARRRGLALLAYVALLSPWLVLAREFRDPAALLTGWRAFGDAWLSGAGCALGAGAAGALLAVGIELLRLVATPRDRRGRAGRTFADVVTLAALVAAVAPPALVGDAFAAAGRWPAWLADHWPIVVLVGAARYAILPIVGLRIATAAVGPQSVGMAALDGADRTTAYLRVVLPRCTGALTVTSLLAALLTMTEVGASALVQPPGVPSLSQTMLNMIHYGRNDAVVATALYLMLLAAIAAVLVRPAGFRRGPRVS
ncbi:MAG: hypothetical protein CHACPFDD_02940 [Phycisphaerae bacterium]|nr:hypothetical protein [Phycisphaerae bacterium]